MLNESQNLVSRQENPMMSFRKVVLYAGPCTNTERKEDVEMSSTLPLKTHEVRVRGMDRDVTECCLKISFIKEATFARRRIRSMVAWTAS
jgi:hypothetical protein